MHRFFEFLPGTLSWLTLILMVLLSWLSPVFIAVFIILFDIYWLLKTVYLSLHLRSTFSIMKKNLKVNWLGKLKELESDANTNGFVDSHRGMSWSDVYHLVILPMYREPYEVVRESFESLAKGNYPLEKFIVVLATEETGDREAAETAKKINAEFGSKFFRFIVTSHPAGLPGEIPGKGSNETWAAREAKRLVIDPLIEAQLQRGGKFQGIEVNTRESGANSRENFRANSRIDSRDFAYENILVSVFDVDTQIFPEYFGRLTYVFLKSADRLRAIYQPIPLFINNVYQAPALARVISFSSTFWQMMQQSRPERLTSFSSQSIPFPVLLDIGYWHTDVVSEDSRSFWQCYLRYHGDFRVEPLFYPVSMDANAAPTFWGTLKNNYRQHRRWAWGCENIPYLMCGKPLESDANTSNYMRIPRIVERELNRDAATNSTNNYEYMQINNSHQAIRSIGGVDSHRVEGLLYDKKIPLLKKWYWSFNSIEGFHSWATNALLIFALGWLPVVLGGKHFNVSLLSYSLPSITRLIVEISMIGVASAAFFSILLLPPRYGEPRPGGGPPRPEPIKWYEYILYVLQWIFLPVTLIIFGCIPALEAQTRMMLGGKWRLGFWPTPKSRAVSSL